MTVNKQSQAATQNQQLNKKATSNEVRQYFTKVFDLKNSGEAFPIELDHVWPLAYSQKKDAMRVLQKEFIEGNEYQAFQNGKVV
jgi:hypothetical protein